MYLSFSIKKAFLALQDEKLQCDETKRGWIMAHHKTIQLPRMFYYSTFRECPGELSDAEFTSDSSRSSHKEFTFMIITCINLIKRATSALLLQYNIDRNLRSPDASARIVWWACEPRDFTSPPSGLWCLPLKLLRQRLLALSGKYYRLGAKQFLFTPLQCLTSKYLRPSFELLQPTDPSQLGTSCFKFSSFEKWICLYNLL